MGGAIRVSPQTDGERDDRGLLQRFGHRFGEHRDRRVACSPGKNAVEDIRPRAPAPLAGFARPPMARCEVCTEGGSIGVIALQVRWLEG